MLNIMLIMVGSSIGLYLCDPFVVKVFY